MTELKKQIEDTNFTDIEFFVLSWFYFQRKSDFQWRRQPSQIFAIVEEEVNDIDIVGIENLEDFPRLVFIAEECVGILKQSFDGGERTRNFNEKKKSGVL